MIINNLIDVDNFWHFLGKLNLACDCNHHISCHIFLNILLYHCLRWPFIWWSFYYYVCLNLLVKHVGFWFTHQLHLVSLNPLIYYLFIFPKSILIDLNSEIAVKSLLFLILDWSVHKVLSLWLRVLNWMFLEKFKFFLFQGDQTLIL